MNASTARSDSISGRIARRTCSRCSKFSLVMEWMSVMESMVTVRRLNLFVASMDARKIRHTGQRSGSTGKSTRRTIRPRTWRRAVTRRRKPGPGHTLPLPLVQLLRFLNLPFPLSRARLPRSRPPHRKTCNNTSMSTTLWMFRSISGQQTNKSKKHISRLWDYPQVTSTIGGGVC